MRKFQPFGRMHGHQLHGVVGQFFVEADVAVEFVEVAEVFDEIAQLLAFALALPLAHECDEALEVLAVGLRRQRRELQPLDQFIQQFGGGFSSRGLAQLVNQRDELRETRRFMPAISRGAVLRFRANALSSSSQIGRR